MGNIHSNIRSSNMTSYFILLAFGLFFIPASQASADCDLCITVVGAVEDFVLAGKLSQQLFNYSVTKWH